MESQEGRLDSWYFISFLEKEGNTNDLPVKKMGVGIKNAFHHRLRAKVLNNVLSAFTPQFPSQFWVIQHSPNCPGQCLWVRWGY